METLSVIIPARKELHLNNTILDIKKNATGPVEIIVVLEGYLVPPLDGVKYIYNHQPVGMRSAVNMAAKVATGKYLMKCDAHCAFDKGFDQKLIADCQPNWIMVPRQYDLRISSWTRGHSPREFMYIEKGTLDGKWWKGHQENGDLVDIMVFQGSFWLMEKAFFDQIGGLDAENYGWMGREGQELALKAWTGGGRVVLSRKTWYAHWTKPRGIASGKPGRQKSTDYAKKVWTEKKLAPLIKKFNPPSWNQ